MTITLVNFTNNYINEKIIIITISPLVSTVSPISLVSLSLHSLLGLPQSPTVSRTSFLLVCISTGLHSLSSLLGLPRSPTVSRTSFFTCVHLHWSPQSLWSSSVSKRLSYFFKYERHLKEERSSTRDSWRPRETKETGETVETSGCAHKHK